MRSAETTNRHGSHRRYRVSAATPSWMPPIRRAAPRKRPSPLGCEGARDECGHEVRDERDPRQAQQLLGDHARQHLRSQDEAVEHRNRGRDRHAQVPGAGGEDAGRHADRRASEQNARREGGGRSHVHSVLVVDGAAAVSGAAAAGRQPHGGQRRGRDALGAVVDDLAEAVRTGPSHSSRASTISSWSRPTKFHHMTISSGNGSPPSRKIVRAGCARHVDVVAGDAEVEQVAGLPRERMPRHPPRRCRGIPAEMSPSTASSAYSHSGFSGSRTRVPGRHAHLGADDRRVRAGGGDGTGELAHHDDRVGGIAGSRRGLVLLRRSPRRSWSRRCAPRGSCACCSKAGPPWRRSSGSATHSCRASSSTSSSPTEYSECEMPRAARHQVQRAPPHHDVAADAVAVTHVAEERPGHGLQPDVRVRLHPHAGALRTEAVEEAPRARPSEDRAAGAPGAPPSPRTPPSGTSRDSSTARAARRSAPAPPGVLPRGPSRAWSRRRLSGARRDLRVSAAGPVDDGAGHLVLAQVLAHERAQRDDRLASASGIRQRLPHQDAAEPLALVRRVDLGVREDDASLAVGLDLGEAGDAPSTRIS